MKKIFYCLSSIVVTVNAVIPIFVLISEKFEIKFKVIVVVLSSLASICTAIAQLFKYQELWLKYRITSESLLREKIWYETHTNKYKNNTEALDLLISTCEDLMGSEIEEWETLSANKS